VKFSIEEEIGFDTAKEFLSDIDGLEFSYEFSSNGSIDGPRHDSELREVSVEDAVQYIGYLQSLEQDEKVLNQAPGAFPVAPCESPIKIYAVLSYGDKDQGTLCRDLSIHGKREDVPNRDQVCVLNFYSSENPFPQEEVKTEIEKYIDIPF
jgi:hypothetical protein